MTCTLFSIPISHLIAHSANLFQSKLEFEHALVRTIWPDCHLRQVPEVDELVDERPVVVVRVAVPHDHRPRPGRHRGHLVVLAPPTNAASGPLFEVVPREIGPVARSIWSLERGKVYNYRRY